jgi:hypothetical protein
MIVAEGGRAGETERGRKREKERADLHRTVRRP